MNIIIAQVTSSFTLKPTFRVYLKLVVLQAHTYNSIIQILPRKRREATPQTHLFILLSTPIVMQKVNNLSLQSY